jgi:hypothetical protein
MIINLDIQKSVLWELIVGTCVKVVHKGQLTLAIINDSLKFCIGKNHCFFFSLGYGSPGRIHFICFLCSTAHFEIFLWFEI